MKRAIGSDFIIIHLQMHSSGDWQHINGSGHPKGAVEEAVMSDESYPSSARFLLERGPNDVQRSSCK